MPTQQAAPSKGGVLAVQERPQGWLFRVPSLPPSVNSATVNRNDGGKAMTQAARAWRDQCKQLAMVAGLRPSLHHQYYVYIWFTMPTNLGDVDNGIKAVLDGLIGSRLDHQVVYVSARKRVAPGTERTTVRIIERSG